MYRLKIIFKTGMEAYVEHDSRHPTYDDVLEESDEVAFSTTGFSLESWERVAHFGEDGSIYTYYPNEGDRGTRYVLKIFRV